MNKIIFAACLYTSFCSLTGVLMTITDRALQRRIAAEFGADVVFMYRVYQVHKLQHHQMEGIAGLIGAFVGFLCRPLFYAAYLLTPISMKRKALAQSAEQCGFPQISEMYKNVSDL